MKKIQSWIVCFSVVLSSYHSLASYQQQTADPKSSQRSCWRRPVVWGPLVALGALVVGGSAVAGGLTSGGSQEEFKPVATTILPWVEYEESEFGTTPGEVGFMGGPTYPMSTIASLTTLEGTRGEGTPGRLSTFGYTLGPNEKTTRRVSEETTGGRVVTTSTPKPPHHSKCGHSRRRSLRLREKAPSTKTPDFDSRFEPEPIKVARAYLLGEEYFQMPLVGKNLEIFTYGVLNLKEAVQKDHVRLTIPLSLYKTKVKGTYNVAQLEELYQAGKIQRQKTVYFLNLNFLKRVTKYIHGAEL